MIKDAKHFSGVSQPFGIPQVRILCLALSPNLMGLFDFLESTDERMDHIETAISGDPSHNQLPNADASAYTSKILLKGPRYGCLL